MTPRDEVFRPLSEIAAYSNVFQRGELSYEVLTHHRFPASEVYRVALGNQGGTVFIKVLSSGSTNEREQHGHLVEREFQILARLWDAADPSKPRVVEPLEFLADHCALITRETAGLGLDRLLLNSRLLTKRYYAKMIRTLGNAGSWLRQLYETTRSGPDGVRQCAEEEINRARKNLTALSRLEDWGTIVEHCEKTLGAGLAETDWSTIETSTVHGDFGPGNLLVSPEGELVALDFSDSRNGVIHSDLASCHQALDQLKVRRPWHRRREVERMQDALLEGFARDTPNLLSGFSVFQLTRRIDRAALFVETDTGDLLGRWQRQRALAQCREALLK